MYANGCILAQKPELLKFPPCNFNLYIPMKRHQLVKHLQAHGAYLLREGGKHSIYQLGRKKTQVPRHNEIVDDLARKICKDLDIPFVR